MGSNFPAAVTTVPPTAKLPCSFTKIYPSSDPYFLLLHAPKTVTSKKATINCCNKLISYQILILQKSSRSEEHTSELQSRENLVCRLLLEKKNKKKYINNKYK